MGWLSIGGGTKTNTSTSNNYDQRVVNDNSGAGTADNGSIATTVQGSGNTVTDSGAFAIVDKLVSQLGTVAQAQTNVARDIALSNTQQGTMYAQNSLKLLFTWRAAWRCSTWPRGLQNDSTIHF